MMKKLLLLTTLCGSLLSFSQNTETKKQKMDFYFNPSVNLGYNIFKEKEVPNNTQYMVPKAPNKISYAITAIGGYNFLPNFALGTGIKYSFLQDN